MSDDSWTDDPNDTPRARTVVAELSMRRAEGVAEMVKAMAQGDWQRNGHIAFAEKWGIAPATAANWAGEASRQLHALERELEAPMIRHMVAARLEKYERMALDRKVYVGKEAIEVAAPDLKAAIAAASAFVKLEGLEKTTEQRAEELALEWARTLLEDLHRELAPDEYARVYAIVSRPRAIRGRVVGVSDE